MLHAGTHQALLSTIMQQATTFAVWMRLKALYLDAAGQCHSRCFGVLDSFCQVMSVMCLLRIDLLATRSTETFSPPMHAPSSSCGRIMAPLSPFRYSLPFSPPTSHPSPPCSPLLKGASSSLASTTSTRSLPLRTRHGCASSKPRKAVSCG